MNIDILDSNALKNVASPLKFQIGDKKHNPSALTTISNMPMGILNKLQKQQELDKQQSYMTLKAMNRNHSLTKDTSNTFKKQESSALFHLSKK